MKGFGARERNGLITFCIVVLLFLMLGPVADRLGCTTRHAPPAPPSTHLPVDTATVVERSDSVKAVEKAESKSEQDIASSKDVAGDSVRKPIKMKRQRKTAPRRSAPADPARRSFLDEPI